MVEYCWASPASKYSTADLHFSPNEHRIALRVLWLCRSVHRASPGPPSSGCRPQRRLRTTGSGSLWRCVTLWTNRDSPDTHQNPLEYVFRRRSPPLRAPGLPRGMRRQASPTHPFRLQPRFGTGIAARASARISLWFVHQAALQGLASNFRGLII
jgi:hypothetical protein